MKQGAASTSRMGSTKVEPQSQKVSPAAVAQLGEKLGNHITDGRTVSGGAKQLYAGRGLQAPMVGQTNHHSGSQGKHK